MGDAQTPLPKRQPLRTREEILQAGREHSRDVPLPPEPAERLATLLALAHPVKPSGAGSPDMSDRARGSAFGQARQLPPPDSARS